ncbi:hypothetical protein J1605_006414 [Eschrichtius robustus]|uniref:Uncharacterized protein n=1 Tax=Eschrichtius robustus TaxID=9764 RepID=A0AB34H3J0_ESCRO|nr:hypothetical protein J1605_006414 [Eschrichtius robustus]
MQETGRGAFGPPLSCPQKSKSPRPESGGGRQPSGAEVDLLERCDREQAVVQDELLQVATRDTEAAAKPRNASLRQGEGSMDLETQRSAQLEGAEGEYCGPGALQQARNRRRSPPESGAELSARWLGTSSSPRQRLGPSWWSHSGLPAAREEVVQAGSGHMAQAASHAPAQDLQCWRRCGELPSVDAHSCACVSDPEFLCPSTVRPNKHRCLEQRKVSCKETEGSTPHLLNSPKGFSEVFFKASADLVGQMADAVPSWCHCFVLSGHASRGMSVSAGDEHQANGGLDPGR